FSYHPDGKANAVPSFLLDFDFSFKSSSWLHAMKVANIETEKSNAVAVLQMALSPALRLVCNFFVIIFL
ncbi:MAG: hypothetical protein II400_04900, partial [Bacteroidaceae bacterium]|nr:hypothetical protein [Bacteroidaceae bacterium]